MDFRLVKETKKWMEESRLVGDCDVVSLAGASKGIADNSTWGEVLLDQIGLSNKLHNADTVILLHHSDCGAYAAAYDFTSPEEEKEKQMDDMAKVEEIIKEKFPQMKVRKIWAQMKDGEGKEVEFGEI